MDDFDFNLSDLNITIVGLGLIGGSYAAALKELKPKNIWGIDIDENTLRTAETLGIIDKGYLEPKTALNNSDLVIMCVYPFLTVEFIKEHLAEFKSGAIITDTAGIKDGLLNEIQAFMRKDLDFIGGHPMAGKEAQGLEFASKEIFKGANYILTPIVHNKPESLLILEHIIRTIGCENIVKTSPQKHDEMIAFTSQLPHIIAVGLINANPEEDFSSFIGGSFKDGTRVANINTDLWAELFMANSTGILKQIKRFEQQITAIKVAIEEKDKDKLLAILQEGSSKRKKINDNN